MLKKITVFLIIFFSLLLFSTTAKAETDISSIEVENKIEPTKIIITTNPVESKVEIKKENVKEIRPSTKTPIKEKREVFQERKLEFKTNVKEKREQFRDTVKQKREEAKESMKAKKEEFRKKAESIRDEKKKELVEKISSKISTVNEKRTDHLSQVLERMTSLVDKMEARLSVLESQGIDTTGIKSAISQARSAITSAEKALTAQAGKQYVIELQEESSLKNDTTTVTSQMEADMRNTQQVVFDAKQSLEIAARALSNIKRKVKNLVPSQTLPN